jgi:hypothetical protein
MCKMTNSWAVVAYQEGRAIDYSTDSHGDMWASRSSKAAYDRLRTTMALNPTETWGVVELHRGMEQSIKKEVGR